MHRVMAVFVLLYSTSLNAQDLWQSYTTDDGLYNNVITSIAVDNNNYKYFEHPFTRRYLSKYDEELWSSFYVGKVDRPSSGLAIDHNNLLWIAGYPSVYDGEKVTHKSSGLKHPGAGIVSIVVDKYNTKWFAYGGDQEYYSGVITYNDIEHKFILNTWGSNLYDLDIDSHDNVWVGINGGLYYFNGVDWKFLNEDDGIPFPRITTVTIDKEDNAWIGNDSYWEPIPQLASFDGKIWKVYTTDNTLLPSNNIFSIEVDHNNTKWIGTDAGVSRFDGETWTTFNTQNSGLCDNKVNAIAVEKNNTIWFGTDNGVSRYTGEVITTSVDEDDAKPEALPVLHSYPNPFNPSTTIDFTLSQSGFVTLAVYNISGQKVRELAADHMTAGSHKLTWDGRDDGGKAVSSGIYITRLVAGKQVAAGRMILLK